MQESDILQNGLARPGAIFNQDSVCAVDDASIAKMKVAARASEEGRYRICMHHSAEEAMQDMVVVHLRGNYSRPHSHPGSAMSYTMIEGRLDVLLFDDHGAVTRTVRLGANGEGDAISIRLSAGVTYMPVCVSEIAVFHETLAGPNPGGSATDHPAWSPADDQPDEIAAFRERLGL